jgi:hypothetical protein
MTLSGAISPALNNDGFKSDFEGWEKVVKDREKAKKVL